MSLQEFCKTLCANCRIVRLLGSVDPSGDKSTMDDDYFELHDIKSSIYHTTRPKVRPLSPDCPLCQALRAYFPDGPGTPRVRRSLTQLNAWITGERRDLDKPFDCLKVYLSLPQGGTEIGFGISAPPTGQTLAVQRLEPNRVDYDLVRRSLNHCVEHHPDSCKTVKSTKIPGFRVIDCERRIVVKLPDERLPYVALSTIQDSITVTKALGFRYLWVDRYCIDQEDEQNKHIQISMMDSVYAQALITIVACAGDAHHGLPGVSEVSRIPQRQLILGDITLTELSRPWESIRDSLWATRAWTLQEGCLSKRRLFFTAECVAFFCHRWYCQEGSTQVVQEVEEVHSKWAHTTLQRIIPDISLERRKERFIAQAVITEYTRRTLSFDRDALNACLGILNTLDVDHHWGVPISRVKNIYPSVMHLCWLNMQPKTSHQRISFPTWSWTCWAGEKFFPTVGKRTDIHDISIRLDTGGWEIIFPQTQYAGDLSRHSSSTLLRVTGTIITEPHFEIKNKTVFTRLTTTTGIYIYLNTILDSGDISLDELENAVLLVYFRFRCERDKAPNTQVSGSEGSPCSLEGLGIVLQPRAHRYRRRGVAGLTGRPKSLFEIVCPKREKLPSGPLRFQGEVQRTVELE